MWTNLNDLVQYCSIMKDIQNKGKECLQSLKEMKMLCAFQSEIQSESLSNYFKEK